MSLTTICPEGHNFLFISSLQSNKKEYADDTVKYGNYENEMWLYPYMEEKKKNIAVQRHPLKDGLRLMKEVSKKPLINNEEGPSLIENLQRGNVLYVLTLWKQKPSDPTWA